MRIFRYSLTAIFLAQLSFAGQTTTVTVNYTPEELKTIFASRPFLDILKEIQTQIDAIPEKEKIPVTDTELAFRWGTDWTGLPDYLESHKMMKPLYAAMNSPKQFLIDRFVPPRLKNKSKTPMAMEPGWEVIDFDSIRADILQGTQGHRIAGLNAKLQGFIGWLFDSVFNVPWVSVTKKFTEDFCKNSQIYKVGQKIVACQTNEVVKIQKSFIDETKNNISKRADIYLHEMIRFKVMLLAKRTSMSQSEQDALTARISFEMLDPNVSAEAFLQKLKEVQLLTSNENLDGLREYELMLTMERKLYLLTHMIAFNSNCSMHGYKLDDDFYPIVTKVVENLAECRRYLKPEMDEMLCEPNTLAFHILDYRNRCKNPLPQKR